jgi:hypothetical protein
MACRSFPPFYEEEKAGVCVRNPPKVRPTTTKDYVILFVLVGGILGLIFYASNPKSLS